MGIGKFECIVSDPPYEFSDRLTMSSVKRGAESNYNVLTPDDLVKLKVSELAADDAVLVLWVPSSQLQLGLDLVEAWGFRQTQTFIWVKTKQEPFKGVLKSIRKIMTINNVSPKVLGGMVEGVLSRFNLNDILTMNLGRWFRQTHEIALVGVKGKYSKLLQSKNQLSVLISPALLSPKYPHSSKPEGLQDRLDEMLPAGANKLEIFGRRERPGWYVIGNECPPTKDQDIRVSIDNLIAKL